VSQTSAIHLARFLCLAFAILTAAMRILSTVPLKNAKKREVGLKRTSSVVHYCLYVLRGRETYPDRFIAKSDGF